MLRQYDGILLACLAALLACGLVFLYSLSLAGAPHFYKQAFFAAGGLCLVALLRRLSVAQWRRLGLALLIASSALLALTLLFGAQTKGAQRWLSFFGFSLQPAEFFKWAFLLALAHWLAQDMENARHYNREKIWRRLLWLAPAFVFLLLQPDFGSFVVLAFLAVAMLFLSGRRLWLLALIVAAIVAFAVFATFGEEYRKDRVMGFIDPFDDPYNSGYHQRMSLISYWRGGLWGVGLGGGFGRSGGQLPEAHTDFILAVVGEDLGYVGLCALCALFFLFVARIMRAGLLAAKRGDNFAALYAFGFALLLAGQAFINLGGSLALLPSKGITFPLISYGGSSLLATLLMLATLLRIDYENAAHARAAPEPA